MKLVNGLPDFLVDHALKAGFHLATSPGWNQFATDELKGETAPCSHMVPKRVTEDESGHKVYPTPGNPSNVDLVIIHTPLGGDQEYLAGTCKVCSTFWWAQRKRGK